MAKDLRTFTKGKMNKELDERLVPDGEYIDALNIRVGSTEEDDMGVAETTLGNVVLTDITVQTISLSSSARCIGALEDGAKETLYWFVHDPAFTGSSTTSKLDLVLSFNTVTQITTYHVISMDDGGGVNTTLNFNPTYLITGVSKIDDLLFFTDNYNPPRKINVTRSYGEPVAATDVDTITAEELLVIRKPPSDSPNVITSFNPNLSATFMDERFICFAYRWRYDDNEYSATSQFTKPAFVPKQFDFTTESFLNEGFVNKHNTAAITFNTGSNLVKGIDILFKEAGDPTIKLVEKLDKAELGYGDDNNILFDFSDSKIFTVLPPSEILRLYDNVPKLAQAQTLMGNRLMYGNYEEGYDLVGANGPTLLNYVCTLRSDEVTSETLDGAQISFSAPLFTLPVSTGGSNTTVTNGQMSLDLTSLIIDSLGNSRLEAGAMLELEFQLDLATANTQTTGGGGTPAQTPDSTITVQVTLIVNANYDSLSDWVSSQSFQNQVGNLTNILPVFDAGGGATSCAGATLTDVFNCARPQTLGTFAFYTSGINATTSVAQPEPVRFSVAANTLSVIFPGLRYVNNTTTPTTDIYYFYKFNGASAVFLPVGTGESLHSNRGYEVGIIYMDEYSRATTALVSNTNALHVPCSKSDLKNRIRVDIPVTQLPPTWATRYKFAIKPDEAGYNTIYANFFQIDTNRNLAYILLRGENTRKVEEGDRLIVKVDTSGAVNSCIYVTVLEKKAFTVDELPGDNPIPGTYMVISTDGDIALQQGPESFKDTGNIEAEAKDFLNAGDDRRPYIFLPMNDPMQNNNSCSGGADFSVPAGSIVKIKLKSNRNGSGNKCEQRTLDINEEFTVSTPYASLKDWFIGESISNVLDSTSFYTGDAPNNTFSYAITNTTGQQCPNSLEDTGGGLDIGANYELGMGKNDMRTQDLNAIGVPPPAQGEYKAQISTFTAGGRTLLGFSGTICCGSSNNKKSTLQGRIQVQRAVDNLVFETLPADAQPDIFFESSQSFPITGGFHGGNVQNQSSVQSAIIDTAFFNCYSYGNGVESYKIRDSIVGKDFNLGNRVTITQNQDYKQVRRYADITYSGVYNQESNINKTNEFNLGLLNFKPLEQIYGYVRKMAGRETDILVLQEDKISYVLAGKNLLSDAVGGGDIASVPEVLGTQIARTEEFGISDNPESYAEYGYDKFFTDAKRGAVIQLRGSSAQNEQLIVISNQGMGTWFRELFQVAFTSQKLGGYDPYSDEYVLCTNTKKLPVEDVVIPCGTMQTYVLSSTPQSFTIDVGDISEDFLVNYSFVDAGSATVNVSYDGVLYGGTFTSDGNFTVPKPNTKPNTAVLTVTGTGTIQVTVDCPVGTRLEIIQVCLTSASDANSLIHNEVSFTQGSYSSPVLSEQVTFINSASNPVVSQYTTVVGLQGQGYFPSDGSTVTLAARRFGADTYVTKAADDIRFVRTNAVYPNTPTGINNLLAGSASVALSGVGTTNTSGTFTMPAGVTQKLYVVYDYRDKSASTNLCYNSSKPELACCCTLTSAVFLNGATLATSSGLYTDAGLTTPAATGWYSDETIARELSVSLGIPQLGPAVVCTGCNPDCTTNLPAATAPKGGMFKATFDITSATGAIIIVYNPGEIPNGIQATYNAVNYNKLSSQNFGKLQSTTLGNAYTMVGTTASQCGNVPGTLNLEVYQASNNTYTLQQGVQESVTIAAGDLALTATDPGTCAMVVPKPLVANATIDVNIPVFCGGAAFDVKVLCPAPIPAVSTSSVNPSSVGACSAPTGTNHYFVQTSGNTTGPELHAYVFTDATGTTPALDGYIAYVGFSYQIQDGIIIAVASC